MNIAVALGSPDISGGTYVIYQHVRALQRAGHTVTIHTREPRPEERSQWYKDWQLLRFAPWPDRETASPRYDLAIGTWWRVTCDLADLDADRYLYFTQSIESRFYPEHEGPLRQLADSTYVRGLPVITEARWIQQHLLDHYGIRAVLVPNGIDKTLFNTDIEPIEPPRASGLRVLVEGPVDVPFKNVPDAIALANQAECDEVWLLTSSKVRHYPGVDRVFSCVPISEVGKIYRACDVLLKLSYVEGMFGPPLEMFHCGGTAIVYDVTGAEEYMVDQVNGVVLSRDDRRGVVEALRRARTDRAWLQKLREGALQTAAAWPDWEVSGAAFVRAVEDYAATGVSPTRAQLRIVSDFHMQSYVIGETLRLENLKLGGSGGNVVAPSHEAGGTRMTASPGPSATWGGFASRVWRDFKYVMDRRYPVFCREASALRLALVARMRRLYRRHSPMSRQN